MKVFKNKQIYRYFNQDIINFNKNYYLTYKTSNAPITFGEFHISPAAMPPGKIINQLYIESTYDFIKTDLSIGDIRNNMCVITITNDSNEKINISKISVMLGCSTRTIHRNMTNELRREKELLNQQL